MDTKMITIHDMETDEIVTREMTQEEIDIQNTPGEFDAQIKAEAEAKATARQVILDRLGLSAEEAQLLLGGN
jgi:hypothetical protein